MLSYRADSVVLPIVDESELTYVSTFGAWETHDARLTTGTLWTRWARPSVFARGTLYRNAEADMP